MAAGDRGFAFLHCGAMARSPLPGSLSAGFERGFGFLLDFIYFREDLAPEDDSRIRRQAAFRYRQLQKRMPLEMAQHAAGI